MPWHAATLVWHYGYWTASSTLVIKVPARNLTFVLLANTDGLSAPYPRSLAHVAGGALREKRHRWLLLMDACRLRGRTGLLDVTSHAGPAAIRPGRIRGSRHDQPRYRGGRLSVAGPGVPRRVSRIRQATRPRQGLDGPITQPETWPPPPVSLPTVTWCQ
jgi:hypothetical protein